MDKKIFGTLLKQLSMTELITVYSLYNNIIANPEQTHSLELDRINEYNGASTLQIEDRQIATIALISMIASEKSWYYYSISDDEQMNIYSNIYNVLCEYIMNNATHNDALTYVKWLD